MAKFLFTMMPANDLGLPTRLVPIARALADRGHDVAVFNSASVPAKLVEDAGLKNLWLSETVSANEEVMVIHEMGVHWLAFSDRRDLGVLVSQVARRSSCGLLGLLILVVVILPAAAGQVQHSPSTHAQGRFARAADDTFRDGAHAKLPPHISTLLGVSKEAECPVMQSVVRTGNVVQGIDVSVANKNDIVLFVVDETVNDQTLYLTSPEGTLRKVVSVKAGVGAEARITDKDRKAFEKEKQFWADRLAPASKAK